MIYTKIDWFSVCLYNRSIKQILELLGFDYTLYHDMLNNMYERSQGFTNVMVMSMYGISIELKFEDYVSTEEKDLFEKTFSKIRLDLSGAGLDHLREKLEVDKILMDPNFFADELGNFDSFNVTRCDFAFDFVNHHGSFVDELIAYLHEFYVSCGNSEARVSVARKGGCVSSVRTGDQKTVYLGSPRADKLLRIYDKKLQFCKKGCWMKPIPQSFLDNEPNGEINSWFRLELQSRKKLSTKYLYNCDGDITRVLRAVFDDYLIRDFRTGEPLKFMVDLYDWETLPPIIQNFDFV